MRADLIELFSMIDVRSVNMRGDVRVMTVNIFAFSGLAWFFAVTCVTSISLFENAGKTKYN